MPRARRTWTDAFLDDPDAFDRRRRRRRSEDGHRRLPPAVLLAAGFVGGVVAGAAVGEGLLAGGRRGLFSRSPMRRYAAVSYLGARPSVDTVRLLRDYIAWESHLLLRRRARRVLRTVEASLERHGP